QGPETAVVVGDGEIDCDEHGRILVRFHWDDVAAHTMRVRVSQNWASKGWGGMVIPRIGMEVIVEHLRGDPDKPIVTGCVYNGKNTTPNALPKHKTRSTFKTNTHQGTGFNELRFEDQKGEEEIFIHAQKDMNSDILDTNTKHVGNNDVELVENNKVIEVYNNHSEVIGGNMVVHVGPTNVGTFIAASMSKLVGRLGKFSKRFGIPAGLNPGGGNLSVSVEKNALHAVGLTNVSTVGLSNTVFVGKTHNVTSGRDVKISAGRSIRLSTGKSVFEMHSDGRIAMHADKISINADTIVKINGKVVDIN
ncbi:type VI secretion system Vgr family protein, partial [Nereida sp. MMG025]|uniref:type VI secretion system Vgr family protein n=1 Tax=Nereida sp. MMG025 TaxID=2909981 RepID=UPI00272E0073